MVDNGIVQVLALMRADDGRSKVLIRFMLIDSGLQFILV